MLPAVPVSPGNWTETMNPSLLPPAPCARPAGAAVGAGPGAPRRRVAVIGAGRLGTVLARELARAGHDVRGPLPRDYDIADVAGAAIVLLCVPDREIAPAAAAWRHRRGDSDSDSGAMVGHCSGATGLQPLRDPAGGDDGLAFSLHPLMTFADAEVTPAWAGAAAAVAGSSPAALATAAGLAADLGLTPVAIADDDRVAYHAAASIASNYLVTLQCAAEALAATCGVTREMLAPLVRATVENWAGEGAASLTGPIARGDEQTVGAQRDAVAARVPELLPYFDALTEATRAIAARQPPDGRVGPAAVEPGLAGELAA